MCTSAQFQVPSPLEGNGIKLSNRVIANSEAIFVLLEIASSSDSSQ